MGSLCQHRVVRWFHHVPRYRRSYAEGDYQHGSIHHEDQDHRSSREEILRLDRRLHLGFSLHLPGNVDLQAGIRRGWSRNRSSQMLLNSNTFFYVCLIGNSDLKFIYIFIHSFSLKKEILLHPRKKKKKKKKK